MFFHLLKGLNPCYLVLKFGNILPINNWDMAQNVISQRSWPWKVKGIGQNKWHHQIPWPRKYISKCQDHHPMCLTFKRVRVRLMFKVKVIALNKWHQLKAFYSSYLVLKFGNVLLLRNWYICRNVILQRSWPWKVKVIGKNKWRQQLPWPQKHRPRHQNLHPKYFSSKVIVKDIFLHNGGQRNAFAYVTRSNRPRYFLIYWKASTQAILC